MRVVFGLVCALGLISYFNSGSTREPDPAARAAALAVLSKPVTPVHKGHINFGSGLYVRVNDDLVVPGSPALVLRRTYLSGYRASKQFGVGATHTGEEFLIGDGERFQWASLILAGGTRINFRRVSPGIWILNARYVHDESATEWNGAELSWTGLRWSIRKRDGSSLTFKSCRATTVCSIIQSEDAAGRRTYFRRDLSGKLLEMTDGSGRRIAFDYDDSGRIKRAHTSAGDEAVYEYDGGGRLVLVKTSDGAIRRYTYTALDELATIEEPGTSIENIYDNGRCVRQVNHHPTDPTADPYVFEFTYHMEGTRVARTDVRTSDKAVQSFTWDEARRVVSESRGHEDYEPLVFTFERNPGTKAVTSVSLTCPDFGAGRVRREKRVTAGNEEEVKAELAAACFESAIRKE